MNPLVSIKELGIRLQYESFESDPAVKLLGELQELGDDANPLVPALVTKLKDGSFPCLVSALILLYTSTKNPDLLQFILSPEFGTLSIADRVCLFDAGVSDMREGLLAYLWQHYTESSNPQRRLIVESLAQSGSVADLEILHLIYSKLTGSVNDRIMDVHHASEVDAPLGQLFAASDSSFAEAVRDACQKIESRNV